MIKEKRIVQFEKMGLGLFIHYGLYSVIAKGEWSRYLCNIDEKTYEKNIEEFNLVDIDFNEIIGCAARAGFKYAVFTARHHDGYSLFNFPYCSKRDLVKDFVAACNNNGVVPFIYHTLLDWKKPEYKTDFNAYLKYLQNSIEYLCVNYGKLGGFWFDGMWDKPNADWQEDVLYGIIRKYQPDAMIINNSGLNALGEAGNNEIDCVTFERGKPRKIDFSKKYLAGEMCDVICSHWGYCENDLNYKSVKNLLSNLVDCRRYGVNYLLNISPNNKGKFDYMSLGIIEQITKWINVYGEILSFLPSGSVGDENFIMYNDDFAYLIVKNLMVMGDENVTNNIGHYVRVVLDNFGKDIEKIEWIDNGNALEFIQDAKLTIKATHFHYGCDFAIRIAKITYKP